MKHIDIEGRRIGSGFPTFIIAEAGVNHNGDLNRARELVRRAKACGADCVKFQTFRAENVVTHSAPKAEYQLQVTDPAESQFEMLKSLELSEAAFADLKRLCASEGIIFLSTPYSLEDAHLLDRLEVSAFKIASAQIVEISFLEAVARMGKVIILSTGMATLEEVAEAVRVIRGAGNDQLILLQCTTNYPSFARDANLRAMLTMAQTFDCVPGYSDHTPGIAVALGSVALGARVVEKHFTLDKSLPGPDHSCSADPPELRAMVEGIREVEVALGSGEKRPSSAELRNLAGMRRSIVAAVDIPKGTVLSAAVLTFKRPATGISPARLNEIVGRTTRIDLPADTLLDFSHLQ